jgi:hypothetical protein
VAPTEVPKPSPTELVIGRLRDFFATRTPWHRRLWNTGTALGLREVLEYADACSTGAVTRTEGLRFVVETARREVARDPGTSPLAKELEACLADLDVAAPTKIPAHRRDELEQLLVRVDAEYLHNWCAAPAEAPVEFTARALASHLLDLGYSPDHLHRWITAVGPSQTSVAHLAGETQAMVGRTSLRTYKLFLPCAAPYAKSSTPSQTIEWLDGRQAAQWLKIYVPESEHRRHAGGFLIEAECRDPWSAVEAARRIVARADARVKVSRPSDESIRLDGWARINGDARSYNVRPTPRQVEIGSLFRQQAVYDFDGGLPPATDDALELASHMESPSDGAAVTGGWAAIEALLIRPGEGSHHIAADRLAALLTCSLVRAELTPLAYCHMENASPSPLVTDLKASKTNHERVRLVEDHLRAGHTLALTESSDIAAERRLVAILRDSSGELHRIHRYFTESLRRLYNQRNTIAHSGSLGSAALAATTRTSFSLVGAGLDRIVHAQLEANGVLAPLSLVARADTELRLVGTAGGRPLSSLLE